MKNCIAREAPYGDQSPAQVMQRLGRLTALPLNMSARISYAGHFSRENGKVCVRHYRYFLRFPNKNPENATLAEKSFLGVVRISTDHVGRF
jgi:hypothetical protein